MQSHFPLFSVSNHKFNVILLAAGMGTRLKPATDYIPKALVELGELRAIDYFITQYQYIAQRIIIAVGYCADLLENYVRGKYPALNLVFSREPVSELKGPTKSLMYALDCADSRLPTIVTFCDYIIAEQFGVDHDALGVCKPVRGFVYGTYKTVAVIEESVVRNLVLNDDLEHRKENGFTGIAICHNTKLLKAIVYGGAVDNKEGRELDFALDVFAHYVKRIRTLPCPLSKMLEFGTEDTLHKTRRHLHGDLGLPVQSSGARPAGA
jgi:NDP-sugar pyrophosphorylase family protein